MIGRLFDLPNIVAHVREVALRQERSWSMVRPLPRVSVRLRLRTTLRSFDFFHSPIVPALHRVESDRRLTLHWQGSIIGGFSASFRVHVAPKLTSLSYSTRTFGTFPPIRADSRPSSQHCNAFTYLRSSTTSRI